MEIVSNNLIKRIKSIVKSIEPSAKIYLYGSRSRGTHFQNSDWDLLILLNKDSISDELEKSITYPLFDLEFETGEVISPMIYTENEWFSKYKVTSFYRNVMKERKLI